MTIKWNFLNSVLLLSLNFLVDNAPLVACSKYKYFYSPLHPTTSYTAAFIWIRNWEVEIRGVLGDKEEFWRKNLDTNLCSPLHQQDDLGLVTTSLNFSYCITKIGLKCLFCWVLNNVMYLKHLALSICSQKILILSYSKHFPIFWLPRMFWIYLLCLGNFQS